MFSALTQGSIVHVLDKTDGLKYKTGEIVGSTQPNPFGGAFGTPSFSTPSPITLKIKIDGEVKDYPEVPANQTVMSYNNGQIVISETKENILNEVQSVHQNSKQILANREYYEKLIKDSESIMSEINPQFKQDKERDDRINALDDKVSSVTNKLDEILKILATKTN